ncbi:MAG TPA: glycosyltransferase family 39 protein [Thermoanaerobaculia bacterium]|nr:glycosyltransferase family 39 protein [Thermoanaerobaculia bacterium]
MTPQARRAAIGLAVLVAASRWLAMPRTFWEWDDYIFGLALHNFAPQAYVPQPPFFPAFIHAARLVRRVVGSDVAALTATSALASVAGAALMFVLVRELVGEARVALSAAALWAFFPASWFYAGTPISDTAGAAAAIAVLALSARALRRPGALLGAAAVFGLAVGIRPQTAVVVLPALGIAAVRNRRLLPAALGVAAFSIGLFWVLPVAAAAGGLRAVVAPIAAQGRYVLRVTSPLSAKPALAFVFRRWAVDPWVSPLCAAAVWLAATAGVTLLARRRERRVLAMLGVGAALYAIAAVLFLDLAATGRYVLPCLPFAAAAVAVALASAEDRAGIPKGTLTAAFVAAFVFLTGPAVLVMHRRPSPPVEAAERIRSAAGGRTFAIVYPAELYVPAALLLPRAARHEAGKTSAAALAASPVPVWRYGVSAFPTEEAAWPRLRPFSTLGMGRYLEVPFGPWTPGPDFGSGWFGEERDRDERFRWMGRRGEVLLPACAPPARLELSVLAPLSELGGPPTIEVIVNGAVVDRRTLVAPRTELAYTLAAKKDAPNRLVLTTDRVFNPKREGRSADDRDLGLEVRNLRWEAAGGPRVPD